MVNLNDLTLADLQEAFINIGEPKFRAKQVFKWFARGVTNLDEMTDISAKTKEKIKENYKIANVNIWQRFDSKLDETKKYLMELDDGNIIETVAMFYKHGITVCISTQVGCNMGCKFCASTLGGKLRNLTAGEILGQIATVQRDLGTRVSNIVLMGIGEPLDNYDNVVTFLKNINDENGICIGYRHISLSTCGMVDKIKELAKENIPITLSVSLHAPDNETRDKIMPVNRKYKVEELIGACRDYQAVTGRRISFEYILINHINDTKKHAENLIKITKGILSHVNLIPANFVEESEFVKSSPDRVKAFKQYLENNGVTVTVRRELGSDISASCGQLRRKHSTER
mgnify:CR=1 FL=1